MNVSSLATSFVRIEDNNNTSTDDELLADKEDLEQKKVEFLAILLTQLQNQNPLDPMDTNEYTAQLIQYSQLEQQMEMNDNLRKVAAASEKQQELMSLGYVGRKVEFATPISVASDGKASWSYTLESPADDVVLRVVDQNGQVILEEQGSTSAGAHYIDFDATLAGINVEDGSALTLFVRATDAEGETMVTNTTTFVTVDGVQRRDDGTVFLTSGKLAYDAAKVLKVDSIN